MAFLDVPESERTPGSGRRAAKRRMHRESPQSARKAIDALDGLGRRLGAPGFMVIRRKAARLSGYCASFMA